MGTDQHGNGPFSPSDVDPTKFGSGGRSYAPSQGYPAAPAILHQLLQRLGYAVANVAALEATVQADRADGMLTVTLDTYTTWVWENESTASVSATVIEPTDTSAGSGVGRWTAVATTPQTTAALGLQSGTGVLTAGVSANISATIASTTRIVVSRTLVNASTTLGEFTVAKTNGSPGHFVVTSEEPGTPGTTQTGDLSSFDWFAIG